MDFFAQKLEEKGGELRAEPLQSRALSVRPLDVEPQVERGNAGDLIDGGSHEPLSGNFAQLRTGWIGEGNVAADVVGDELVERSCKTAAGTEVAEVKANVQLVADVIDGHRQRVEAVRGRKGRPDQPGYVVLSEALAVATRQVGLVADQVAVESAAQGTEDVLILGSNWALVLRVRQEGQVGGGHLAREVVGCHGRLTFPQQATLEGARQREAPNEDHL